MKNKFYNEEIDLLEIIIQMWKHKLKVVLIIIISLFVLLIYEMSKKPSENEFEINTKLESISTFEETKYASYNNYVDNVTLDNNKIVYFFDDRNLEDKKITSNTSNFHPNAINYSVFKKITKSYLLNLFVEKINDPSFNLLDILDNSDLNKMNDDRSKEQLKKSYSIKIIKNEENTISLNETSYNIILKTNDLESGKKIIILLNKYVNNEIRSYLLKEFNYQVLDVTKFKEYMIEDINFAISNNFENEKKVLELEKIKNSILNNKKLIRLENIFKKSPINNKEEFIASNMVIESQNQIIKENSIYGFNRFDYIITICTNFTINENS